MIRIKSEFSNTRVSLDYLEIHNNFIQFLQSVEFFDLHTQFSSLPKFVENE